ncbi:hypothetical protein [Arsenicicoccus dermatophilus]|uniref:hypothetical protein n=1 Tax=Arsenicicoccus dermatophilus TaxID=1076331 RepID=UPI001F4CC51C|nr:hypothetical protein [Arsenicicoccus dermatophilus]MCH8613282.1 hypothetical protein [Arsenicicoccus dermatophilus]
MTQTARPTLVRTLVVLAALAAALVGLVAWIYALALTATLDEEFLPLPSHVPLLTWAGIALMLLGGATALTTLLLRRRALAAA